MDDDSVGFAMEANGVDGWVSEEDYLVVEGYRKEVPVAEEEVGY